MSYVVVIDRIDLPPRLDNTPWITAELYEGPSADGPWTLIATKSIPSYDPADPGSVSITSRTAALAAGWYYVKLIDDSNAARDSEPSYRTPLRSAYVPSRQDVGALIRLRTVTDGGQEAGTFNENTRPTGEQADRVIGQAVGEVTEVTGVDLPESVHNMVRSAVTLRAAMLIELSYFPGEQRSPYDQLEKLYNERIKALRLAVEQAGAGDEPGAVDDNKVASWGGFPAAGTGMTEPW